MSAVAQRCARVLGAVGDGRPEIPGAELRADELAGGLARREVMAARAERRVAALQVDGRQQVHCGQDDADCGTAGGVGML